MSVFYKHNTGYFRGDAIIRVDDIRKESENNSVVVRLYDRSEIMIHYDEADAFMKWFEEEVNSE